MLGGHSALNTVVLGEGMSSTGDKRQKLALHYPYAHSLEPECAERIGKANARRCRAKVATDVRLPSTHLQI